MPTLPESERTVITLHYFGEMTCEKISEFLGVSANTIKSRLRRARNRLKQEEPMIREAITNFKISPNLTNNIMQEITKLITYCTIHQQTFYSMDNRCIKCVFDYVDAWYWQPIYWTFPVTTIVWMHSLKQQSNLLTHKLCRTLRWNRLCKINRGNIPKLVVAIIEMETKRIRC